MRVRNIRGIEKKIEETAGEKFIIDPSSNKGIWKKVFNNNNPIHIEIGCGKGKFITSLAQKNKNINYIAIEKVEEILYKTVLKLDKEGSLRIILGDGNDLLEYFAEDEIERIYLNFSDPWPKKRHHKRRLTSDDFLDKYRIVLKNQGKLILKTDNTILFEYSLNTLNKKWLLENISLDYHPSEEIEDFPTEYEEKFRKKGIRIYRLEAINQK